MKLVVAGAKVNAYLTEHPDFKMLQFLHRLESSPSRSTTSNCITLFALITQRWPVHSCSFPRHTPLTPALLCEMDTEYFPEAGAYFPTSERLEEPWGLLSHHYLTQTQTQHYMQAGRSWF